MIVIATANSKFAFDGASSSQTGSTTIATTSLAQTTTNNQWGMEKPCSYEVFTDGTTIYAQNCDTGSIDYSGTVAATIINDAIAALTSGGKVFIKAGIYTLTTAPIHLYYTTYAAIGSTTVSNVDLSGEGNSTILRAGVNLDADVIGVSTQNGWHIHDLQIDGNRAQQSGLGNNPGYSGIDMNPVNGAVVENNYVHDCKTYGIAVSGVGDQVLNNHVVDSNANGIFLYGGSDYLVEGNFVDGASDVGISISGQSSTQSISGVICEGNIILNIDLHVSPYGVNSGDAIITGDNGIANNVTISDNYIYLAYYGIFIGSTTNILVSDNQIYPTVTCGLLCYGIAISASSVIVQGNIIGSAHVGMYVYSSSSSVQILDNSFTLTADPVISYSSFTIISANLIRGWAGGGFGITLRSPATNDIISHNTIFDSPYSPISIDPGVSNCTVDGNLLYDNVYPLYVGGTNSVISNNLISGQYLGIDIDSSASGTVLTGNDLRNDTYPIGVEAYNRGPVTPVTATRVTIKDNVGYNPLGNIASPFVSSGNYILDGGGTSTPVNATTMTVWQSPKLIIVTIGSSWTSAHTLVIKVDGTQILSTTTPEAKTVIFQETLQPGENFYIQWQSGQATFVVSGQ